MKIDNLGIEHVYKLGYFYDTSINISVEAGAPGQPRVDEVTQNSATISWDKPKHDGGGRIFGYVVEVKPKGGEWVASSTGLIKDYEFTVSHLKEGQEYEFRVRAVNEAGPGTPSPSSGPVVAQKPQGLFS